MPRESVRLPGSEHYTCRYTVGMVMVRMVYIVRRWERQGRSGRILREVVHHVFIAFPLLFGGIVYHAFLTCEFC
jgi:hypothetical protein